MLYGYILSTERRVQRLRRRIVRYLPVWAVDALSALKYVNFLKLQPTLCAIFFAPHHFYRKLPRIVQGKSRYLTPVKALTTFAALVVLVEQTYSHRQVDGIGVLGVLGGLLLLALSAPVWGLLFAKISSEVKKMPVGQLLPFDASEDLLLSWRAWKRLNLGLYCQGLLYFTIYFVLALPLIELVLFGIAYVAATAIWQVPMAPVDNATEPALSYVVIKLSALMLFVITGLTLSRLVNRPLAALFRHCLRVPTFEAYSIELGPMKARIEKAFGSAMMPSDEQKIASYIRAEWGRIVVRMSQDERRAAIESCVSFDTFLSERATACQEVAGLRLWLADQDRRLIDLLDAVSKAQPISHTSARVASGADNVSQHSNPTQNLGRRLGA
jgi:hypothetical protein